jgi:16S rRNA (cytidine1402-2'-O)-methyltransferase
MSRQPENSLYVVATPIGNLKDITIRALDILSDVDLVFSEHVRKTRNLLRHFGIKSTVLSYREENALRVIPRILKAIEAGKSVALVAEAGTPGISDPGRRLVEQARSAGVSVVPVPGASAVTAALSVAGMEDARFVFEGFLPRRAAKRRRRLAEIALDPRPLVLYESPHRLVACLEDVVAVLGDRRCLIAREMTKIHEEIIAGRVSELLARFRTEKPRGEFVVVCQGRSGDEPAEVMDRLREETKALIEEGMKKTKALRIVARKYGLKADDVSGLIGKM